MDIFEILIGALTQVWYIIPLLIVVSIFKSRWFKGVFGEFLVNKLLSQLPDSDYTLVRNVTLPTDDGTTQIDHIVVSRFGIFVVETKNMKGWIFGSKSQKQWTQKVYRHSSKFQNPLHQNYKHVKTLESLLAIDCEKLHSVVVFIGDSTFKTDMPENVTYARGCLEYI
ncbi:nuclease-related domain-containing protein, partial [Vibrio vulnificus]